MATTSDVIGWMRNNNRAARAASTWVEFFDVVCQTTTRTRDRKSFYLYVHFNSTTTSHLEACFVNNIECEQETNDKLRLCCVKARSFSFKTLSKTRRSGCFQSETRKMSFRGIFRELFDLELSKKKLDKVKIKDSWKSLGRVSSRELFSM